MPRRSTLLVACLTSVAVACSGANEGALAPLPHRSGAPHPGNKPRPSTAALLRAHRFAEVSDVIGPYVGRDGEESVAVWAEAAASGRSLVAAPLDAQAVPGAPVRVATLAPELDLVLVRGLGAASSKLAGHPRFAVVTSRRSEQRTRIELSVLRADASAVWGPVTLAERGARVMWLGLVVAGEQPLLLWAEQPSGSKAGEPAALYSAPIAADGKPSAPVLVNGRACVWQAAAMAGQAAVASVRASGGGGCGAGSVALDLLGVSGRSEKTVEVGARAGLDLDLVATKAGFLLAWSDREELEPHALTALVDVKGMLRTRPGAAVPALSEQAVVGLVAGESQGAAAFLVWENVSEQPDGARYFEVSALDETGRASGPHARLLYARLDGGAPELVAYDAGVAALTLAPACGDSCEGRPPVPTFVAFDRELELRASEPLLLDALSGRAPDLGWGLTCPSAGCFALAAPSRSPAALYSVPLPLRDGAYRAAAETVTLSPKPRVRGAEVLLGAPAPLAQIAVAHAQAHTLVGYVTDFDPTTPWQKLSKPAEDGRLEPLRARVALRSFDDVGFAPAADEQVVSLRAHSLAGFTLLGDAGGKDALAIWGGLDKGEPQVFLTALGPDGKRGQQRMLTHKRGAASDSAGLALDAGYLVAWVDERSGDAEVYAARVGKSLDKAGPEQRITSAEGAASDLRLSRVAGKPYAVWADARDGAEPGWADIYGAFLRPSDAAREGHELRLSNTRPHSFAPQVGQLTGGAVLAWLEEAGDGTPASVRLSLLGPGGELDGNVSVVPIEAGAVRGLGLDCKDVLCRVVVTVELEGRGEIYGFEWRPSTEANATRLASLGEPAAAGVSPIVRGSSVFVADAREGRGLVRRLSVEW